MSIPSESLQVQSLQVPTQTEVDIDEAFLKAAYEGNISELKNLLDRGANVNGSDQKVPLLEAALSGNFSAVQFLITHGAIVDKASTSNVTAFLLAVDLACNDGLDRYKDILEYLLKHNADINHNNSLGYCALGIAVSRGSFEMVEFLLKNGAIIPHTDPHGKGHSFLLPSLMGCVKKTKNEHEQIVLECTPQFDKIQRIIPLLIKHGFDINFQPIPQDLSEENHDQNNMGQQRGIQQIVPLIGYSPLMLACELGYLPLVDFIIKQGAKVDQIGGYYNAETPLSIAARMCNFDLIFYLVEFAKAKLNPIQPIEQTPILTPVMYAHLYHAPVLMHYLIEKGAAAEPPDRMQVHFDIRNLTQEESHNRGNIILQAVLRLFDYAWSGVLPENVTLTQLLKAGAHLNQRTKHMSNSPLHLACMNNNIKALRNFMQELKNPGNGLYDREFSVEHRLGFTLSAVNNEGLTPFDIAASSNIHIANIFRNSLQPFVDYIVFQVLSIPGKSELPIELVQKMFELTYAPLSWFAKTREGYALISQMFEKSGQHYKILCRGRSQQAQLQNAKDSIETKELKEHDESKHNQEVGMIGTPKVLLFSKGYRESENSNSAELNTKIVLVKVPEPKDEIPQALPRQKLPSN